MARKRSKSIKLVAMGTTMLVLAACDEPAVDVAMFESIDQCMATQGLTEEQCEQRYSEAKDMHAKVAPKYTSAHECEADFGAEKCEASQYRTQGGSRIYMPLMVGYMWGGRGYSQPLYRSADDPRSFRTADNRRVGSGATGFQRVARGATEAPSTKTTTTRRGGFGAHARVSSAG